MPTMSTGQGHEVFFLPVSANAAGGDTTVIPADAQSPTRKVRIFNLVLFAKAACVVTMKSGSTAISGAMSLAINSGFSAIAEPSAHFMETAPGQAFVINTSADGVYGWVAYTVENR
jgi:hypothetical protein